MNMESAVDEVKNEVGFADKFKAAWELVRSLPNIKVKNPDDHKNAESMLDQARQWRKDLKKDYDENLIVIKARHIQEAKVEMDKALEKFVSDLKNGAMLSYEREEEAKRQAEEQRLANIRQASIDKENARLAKIAADEREAAEKESARLSAIAAKTKDKEKKESAELAAQEAKKKAEAAAAEQKRLADEKANNPQVTVVLESTAPVASNRRIIKRWRIKSDDGKVHKSDDFKPSTRLPASDFSGLEKKFFILNPMAISGIVDSLGKNHGIPGVEYWEEPA